MTLEEMQKKKDEIIATADMFDVLARYKINVRGRMCRCFFHNERNPSMKVFRNGVHCFTCGKSWNVFDVTMELNRCDFKTAFELLGGTEKPSFRATVLGDKARKEREHRLIQEQQQKERERARRLLIRAYRNIMEEENRLSDLYVYCYNKLQYLLYQVEYELEMR